MKRSIFIALLLIMLCLPLALEAHNCSSPGDCEETAGYNAVIAVVGGVIAAIVGLLGASLSGAVPPIYIDPVGDGGGTTEQDPTDGDDEPEKPELTEEQVREQKLQTDVKKFLKDHPEYARVRNKLYNKDGTINTEVLNAIWTHHKNFGPGSEYAKAQAARQKHLNNYAKNFFDKHPEYDKVSKRVFKDDGTVDEALLRRAVTHYHKYGGPQVPQDDTHWAMTGLDNTFREILTGRDMDGNTSYKSFVLRGLLAVSSGGSSEWGYVPGDAMYRLHDGVMRGEGGIALVGKVAANVVLDELIGKALGKGLEKGLGKLVQKFPGLAKNVGDYTDDIMSKLRKPLLGGKPGPISPDLTAFKKQMQAALDSGDDEALKALFKNKGMKKLGQLEGGGHLNNKQAQQLVQYHDKVTGGAIADGTSDTITQFRNKYGIAPDEVLVGNSGSTGPYRSVVTDADRTLVTSFGDDAVEAYAKANNMTMADAAADLQNKFTNMHSTNVDVQLQNRGLSAADMDTASYSGFGSGAGPPDSYPMGYTKSRQSIQGSTDVYKVDADGAVRSYQTSGDAILDQHGLNASKYGGDLPTDPTRIGSNEMGPLLDQQRTAISKYTDPKGLAKAVDRAHYVAGRTGNPLPDPDIVRASQMIRSRPQDTKAILDQFGLTNDSFAARCKDMMANY